MMAITQFNAELTECLSLYCSNVLFKYVAIERTGSKYFLFRLDSGNNPFFSNSRTSRMRCRTSRISCRACRKRLQDEQNMLQDKQERLQDEQNALYNKQHTVGSPVNRTS